MSGIEKIERARLLLEKQLEEYIIDVQINYDSPRLVALLRDGTKIYIRYNDHEQYTYSIVFSSSYLDKCLFDNYGDKWEVSTRPHHFHARFQSSVSSSPMVGIPETDVEELCNLVLPGKLFSPDLQFS